MENLIGKKIKLIELDYNTKAIMLTPKSWNFGENFRLHFPYYVFAELKPLANYVYGLKNEQGFLCKLTITFNKEYKGKCVPFWGPFKDIEDMCRGHIIFISDVELEKSLSLIDNKNKEISDREKEEQKIIDAVGKSVIDNLIPF